MSTSNGNDATPLVRLSIIRDLFTSVVTDYYLKNPNEIYSLNRPAEPRKNPYTFQEDVKGNSLATLSPSQIDIIKAEVEYAQKSANERRDKWNQMVDDAKPLRPSFQIFTDKFWSCSDQFAFPLDKYQNFCINCLGATYTFIYGIIMLLIYLLCTLIAYPLLTVVDIVSGRSRAQAAWIRNKLIDENYSQYDSASTDAAIFVSLQRSAVQLSNTLGPRFVVTALQDLYKLTATFYDSEDKSDYTVLHDCARFSIIVKLSESGGVSNV